MAAKERLKEYLNTIGVGRNKFEGLAGVSFGYLSTKATSISSDVLEKALSLYPELSADWLLTGKGNMTREDNRPTATLSDDQKEGIPLIPLSAMAGAFAGERQVLECECEHYIVPAFAGADYLIHVKGDSMQPSYNAGDIVACKNLPLGDLFFQWNKVYVLNTDQGALIKRIRRGSDSEHVLIVSDNEIYEPFELPVSAIYGVSLVIGTIRLE